MSENGSGTGELIGIGDVVGMILCWVKFHSLISLIWPLIFGWLYVIYFIASYGLPKG